MIEQQRKPRAFQARAHVALKKFIDYVNLWLRYEYRDNMKELVQLTVEEFFKYGETRVVDVVSIAPGEELQIFWAGYGDEGGPSLIVAKFRNWPLQEEPKKGRPIEGSWELQWLMQEFDTMGSMIWSEGKFVNTPPEVT